MDGVQQYEESINRLRETLRSAPPQFTPVSPPPPPNPRTLGSLTEEPASHDPPPGVEQEALAERLLMVLNRLNCLVTGVVAATEDELNSIGAPLFERRGVERPQREATGCLATTRSIAESVSVLEDALTDIHSRVVAVANLVGSL